jgi:hypothetical protein
VRTSDNLPGHKSPTSGKDFDEALVRAETLLDLVDRGHLRARTVQSVSFVLILAVAFGVTLAIGANRLGVLSAVTLSLAAAVIAALGAGCLTTLVLYPIAKQVRRDERAMIEIIGILRELVELVARSENWSTARQQIARTRIARFPIGSRGIRFGFRGNR